MKVNQIFALLTLLGASHSLFAMQALTDQLLSQSTGQDGIKISVINSGTSARVLWHDNDGWAGRGVDAARGSLILGDGNAATNFRINGGTTNIVIDADGGTGTNNAMLNIGIQLPDQMEISTGDISIAGSDGAGNIINNKKIMNDMQIQLHGLNLNMQLGHEAQGHMILATGTIASGIRINNFGLLDGSASTGTNSYGIGIGQIRIKDTGAANNDLTIKGIAVDINSTGLVIDVIQGGNGVDVQLNDLRLGDLSNSATALGNAELRGLKLVGSSLTISGH